MGGLIPSTMKTVQIELFTFEELAPEIQKKVVENNRYMNVEYFDWYHSIIEEWTAKLEEAGYMDPEILFSGFCSQGDGASFTCKSLDWNKIMVGKYAGLLELANEYFTGKVSRSPSIRYVHEKSTSVEIYTNGATLTDEQEALVGELEKEINAWMVETNKTIYKELESDYDFQTSDDVVRECLINQEGMYEKDGTQRYD